VNNYFSVFAFLRRTDRERKRGLFSNTTLKVPGEQRILDIYLILLPEKYINEEGPQSRMR